MGCHFGKQSSAVRFKDSFTHQENSIKVQKRMDYTSQNEIYLRKSQKEIKEAQQIQIILKPIQTQITRRNNQEILKDIVKLQQQCIHFYRQHDIDSAQTKLHHLQKDIKELQSKGYMVQMNKHFKEQFIQLSHIITQQYEDILNFNRQILSSGWKVQKDKKNFKVSSRIEGNTVGILLQSVLQVPFQNFIAVMIQPNLYKQFLPFIKKSIQQVKVARNCKVAYVEMQFPIISNRQSFFQGILYNRLNNTNTQDQELFMYTRSIHNRPDIQNKLNYQVKINPKSVQFQYKYLVIKYVPLTDTAGKMIMGLNIDLKLNMLPMKILEMVSISFSQDFFDNIVKISKNFKGSKWQKGLESDRQLFDFTKKVKDQYLQKLKR